MKAIALPDANLSIEEVLDDAQHEQILITRAGKPSALITGIEKLYDEEDFAWMSDREFWRMIQERRKNPGKAYTLAEVKARLEARERDERAAAKKKSKKPPRRKASVARKQ